MKFSEEQSKFIIDYIEQYKKISSKLLSIPFKNNTEHNYILSTLNKNKNLPEDIQDLKDQIECSISTFNYKLDAYISECKLINEKIYSDLEQLDISFYECMHKIPQLNFTNGIVLFHRNIEKNTLKNLEQVYNELDLFYNSYSNSDIIYYNKNNIGFHNLVSNIVNKLNDNTNEDNSILYNYMQNSSRNCSAISNELKNALMIKFKLFSD